MKIVLNRCFGGFGLSSLAEKRYLDLKGEVHHKDKYFYCGNIPRTDEHLIQVIEELGSESNGSCANLEIIDIPDEDAAKYKMPIYDSEDPETRKLVRCTDYCAVIDDLGLQNATIDEIRDPSRLVDIVEAEDDFDITSIVTKKA